MELKITLSQQYTKWANNINKNVMDSIVNIGSRVIEHEIELYREMGKNLAQDKLEDIMNEKMEEQEILLEGFMNREDEISAKEKELQDREKILCDAIKKFEKFSFNSTVEKGKYGEDSIISLISDIYDNCDIQNKSKSPHSADIWVIFPEDNCTLLVESKIRETIDKKELQKFEEDVKTHESNIDVGLFVSLLNTNIPHKGDMYIENISDKYVGYITDVYNSPKKLKVMIRMLRMLLRYTRNTSEETKENIIDAANTHLNKISCVIDRLINCEHISSDMKLNSEKMDKEIKEIRKILHDELYNFDIYMENMGVRKRDPNMANNTLFKETLLRKTINDVIDSGIESVQVKHVEKATNLTKNDIISLGGIRKWRYIVKEERKKNGK